jgi:hypothetical protein
MSEEKERVFSQEELDLMQRLGLTPEKVASLAKGVAQREKRKKEAAFMTEYYLKHLDCCSLCGNEKVSYFKMQREYTNGGEFLHSIPISCEEFAAVAEVAVTKKSLHLTCEKCSSRLSSLEKEDLVKLCIALQRRVIK